MMRENNAEPEIKMNSADGTTQQIREGQLKKKNQYAFSSPNERRTVKT